MVRQQTLILHGDDDPVVPIVNARIMQRLLPNAAMSPVPRGGHLYLYTRPQQLGRLFPRIANALAQLWSDHGQAQQALEGLLVDRRGGRRGLPDPVQAELLALQAHLKSRPVPPPAPAPMPRETQELLHARRVLEAAGYRVIAPAS